METIIRKFNEAGVRYLIAGGFAVIAHGYTRFTMDLDLVLDLNQDNALKALEILKSEGYAPTIPVPIEQFADKQLREDWAQNRNMIAFPLSSDVHSRTNIDLFVSAPFDFERAYADRLTATLFTGVDANFVGFSD